MGTPDGVSGSNRPGEAYVDGVSITHGKSPHKHIWTCMASQSEKKPICPCSTGSTVKVPEFIGKNLSQKTLMKLQYLVNCTMKMSCGMDMIVMM